MNSLRRLTVLSLMMAATLGLSMALAQDANQFGDTFAEMPVDRATTDMIDGSGTLSATLEGNVLEVNGTFEGLLSPATAAHIHQGQYAPGVPGPPIIDLTVTNGTSGSVTGTVELSDEQLELLQAGLLYVQIHSENNPGGVLRAWLWPR